MDASANPYRALPGVDELNALLRRHLAEDGSVPAPPPAVLTEFVQNALARTRARIGAGELDAEAVARHVESGGLVREIVDLCRIEAGRGVVPAVNATGVVLHTNLGRAPVHPEVADAMARAASGYCVLELDRFSAQRNERDGRVGELLARATGAETGIVVNNCAAAAFLMMQTFAGGSEAIVSRGELVEIGGSFRVPDVMARAGATLVEVGTTNRTRIADYERAITERTGLLMKVHTSNFRVVGFTEEVDPKDLAELGRSASVTTGWDLGSGRFEADGARSLDVVGDETEVRDAVASGVDVVAFSGDKLLGAPQAGLIVGRRAAVRALRKNPIYRALRLDKVALAGLETTLGLLAAGRGDEIPARRMMHSAAADLMVEARRLAGAIDGLAGFSAQAVESESQPGSGSAPTVFLPSAAVRVDWERGSAEALANALRAGEPPVFVRIQDDSVHLDPRALLPARTGLAADADRLLDAFRALA
ncbi:MAG: L-seryl-tRNA(Sec) selenium transferase [Planctomycetota bacterium]